VNYVEWLRVRNCLRITLIILGILVVLALILRISVARYPTYEGMVTSIANAPGTTQRHVTLPDGTKRTIIDNPARQIHIVVDDVGSSGKHIIITEPTRDVHEHGSHFDIGNVEVRKFKHGSMTTTTIDVDNSVPLLLYMAFADVAALIVATILAAPFAREMDGHLEIALTKPITRARFAVGAIGADAAGIIAALVATVIAVYVCTLFFGIPKIDFSGVNGRSVPMGIAMSLAWYALLCAGTAWIGRGYGAVLGFAWPVALLVNGLAKITPNGPVAAFVHQIAWLIAQLNPLWHASWAGFSDHDMALSAQDSTFGLRFAIEVLLFAVYAALAVWRWQRVEA
jgi:ABC-type transport system involved in multi-copper enzyme maturation permease subunit